MDQLEEQVIELIAQETGCNPSKISLDSRINYELGIDGDDALELLMVIQKTFLSIWRVWITTAILVLKGSIPLKSFDGFFPQKIAKKTNWFRSMFETLLMPQGMVDGLYNTPVAERSKLVGGFNLPLLCPPASPLHSIGHGIGNTSSVPLCASSVQLCVT